MPWAVTPTNDIYKHDDYNTTCRCHPDIVFVDNGDMVILHNAFDAREIPPRILQTLTSNLGTN